MSTPAQRASPTKPREPRLDHQLNLPILGIQVGFESNDSNVIGIADEAFGPWRVLENAPRLISELRVRFRIFVEDGDESTVDGHSRISYKVPDLMRVILHTTGTVGVADAARRESVLYTTRALIADRQHFRYGVLEALLLAVLTRLDRMPLHAACIARGDTALLLAAPSGTGKSTLAYAAARNGYAVMSEDYVNVQLEPRLRVWGMPGFVHLPPEAAAHFPELASIKPSLMANGKQKIAISIAQLGALPALPVAQRAGICVIERATEELSAPVLQTLDAATLQEALTSRLDPGFDAFAANVGECVRLLCGHGGWKLRIGGDPLHAMSAIDTMFEALS